MPGALDQQALSGILEARKRHLLTMAHLGEIEDKITPEIGAGYRDALDYGRNFERALVRIDEAQQDAKRRGVGTQITIDEALDDAADQAEIDPEESAENASAFFGGEAEGESGEKLELLVDPETGSAYVVATEGGAPTRAAGPVDPVDAVAQDYAPKYTAKALKAVTGALDRLVPWEPPPAATEGETAADEAEA